MTAYVLEHEVQIAELSASRFAQEAEANASRLAAWQRRYWHKPVSVPTPVNPPQWPCSRVSIVEPSKITRLPISRQPILRRNFHGI